MHSPVGFLSIKSALFCSGPCDSKPRVLTGCSKVIGAWAMGADSFSYPEEAGIPIGKKIKNQSSLCCCSHSS